MDKNSFRKKYKTLRAQQTVEDIESMSLAIANQAIKLPIWDGTYYHVFLPISDKKEVDTEFLLHILQGRDKSIVISKTDFKNSEMEHYLLQENTSLKVSNYGIPEPVEGIEVAVEKLDVVFIPLLTFDVDGNRIGYGKGFYDQFLSQCKNKTVFVGLSLFEAEHKIPSNQEDVALHYCITPKKLYTFKKSCYL